MLFNWKLVQAVPPTPPPPPPQLVFVGFGLVWAGIHLQTPPPNILVFPNTLVSPKHPCNPLVARTWLLTFTAYQLVSDSRASVSCVTCGSEGGWGEVVRGVTFMII